MQRQHRVASGHAAGTTQLAVIGVEHWQEVAGALNPNFQLNGEQALAKTLATNLLFSEQMIDAMNASLGAGFPTVSTSSSQTTTLSTEKPDPATSYTSTTTKAPGAAPTPGAAPAVTKPAALGPLATFAPGIEAGIQYSTAAALFQEVQLLNRQTQMPMLRKGYRPYIMRLQVTVLPHARGQPYDTYADISFMLPRGADGLPPPASVGNALPTVVPLLVTDVGEQSLQSRAAEILRQFSLSATGQLNGIGLAGGFGRTRDDLAQALGSDINALSTVSRVNTNTLRVRLGAANTGSSGFSTLPRSNFVTVLLLVPKEQVLGFTPESIPVTMHTWFRDVRSGEKLPAVDASFNAEIVAELQALTTKYSLTAGFEPYCAEWDKYLAVRRAQAASRPAEEIAKLAQPDAGLKAWLEDAARFCRRNTRGALNAANAEEWAGRYLYSLAPLTSVGDYVTFAGALKAVGMDAYADAIWSDLTSFYGGTGNASDTAFLKPFIPPRLPPAQQALLLDDGTAQASATLGGARGMRSDQLAASLTTDGDAATSVTLQASSVQVSGGNLTVAFPSPKLWSIATGDPLALKGAITVRAANPEGEIESCAATPGAAPVVGADQPKECQVRFPISYRNKTADPKLPFDITTTVATVAIQEKGAGVYRFAVKRNSVVPAGKTAKMTLKADGAVIEAVNGAAEETNTYSWAITTEGLVTVTLSQLTPGQRFNLILKGDGGATQSIAIDAKAQEPAKGEKDAK